VAPPLLSSLAGSEKGGAMYKRVLVPVDGSEVAAAVLPFLLGIAGPLDFEVLLLRVNEPTRPMAVEGTRYFLAEQLEVQRAETFAYLAGLAMTLEARGLRVRTCVRRGDAATEILSVARDEAADLIAMTTHGRTGPARLMLGSVTEYVLRHAEVPVFVLRQTEKDLARRARDVEPATGRRK
jgi:nucleotide-binding universal stress UspA family protein